jgi:hypothetical protein
VAHFLHLATGMTDSLTIVAAQHLGVLTVADLKRIDNMVPRGTVSIVPNTLRFDQDGTGALEHMEFLFGPNEGWIAGVNVERFASWETRPNGWSDMPLVVAGNAQADICLWLTLKSLRWSPEESAHGPCSVYWIPDDVLTDETFNADVPSAYLQRIVGGLTGAVAVVSASLDGEGLVNAGHAWNRSTRLLSARCLTSRSNASSPFVASPSSIQWQNRLRNSFGAGSRSDQQPSRSRRGFGTIRATLSTFLLTLGLSASQLQPMARRVQLSEPSHRWLTDRWLEA